MLVLDVNMPKLGGLEVLRWLETREGFKDLILVMLTTSQNPDIFDAAKKNGATCLQKPMNLDGWVELVRAIQVLIGG